MFVVFDCLLFVAVAVVVVVVVAAVAFADSVADDCFLEKVSHPNQPFDAGAKPHQMLPMLQ